MRKTIASLLSKQAKRFIQKQHPKIVVVTGSVGKTSTTQAIATVLSTQFRVIKTLKNYNSDVGVPCSIFQTHLPVSLKNPFAWIYILLKHEIILLRKSDVEILVLELGTDHPGEIAEFSWLQPDIAVVTAVAAEHMEYFKTLDAVAQEELSVAEYSEKTLYCQEMVAPEYVQYAHTDELFTYHRSDLEHVGLASNDLQVIGLHSTDAVSAAISVGRQLGMKKTDLRAAALKIHPQKGRMQKLQGVNNSVLIDDTYNSSPEAVIAALKYIYSEKAPQKIALIGNMNELGDTSESAHIEIGKFCDPKQLDLVVTLGQDANNFTASSAKYAGCIVNKSQTPYEAAKIILGELQPGALILLKGSQNGVFAEEAVKMLLKNDNDESKLVRQDKFWMKIKKQNLRSVY